MDEERIGMIGFGEAAGAFLDGWGIGGSGRVRAYDLKLRDPAAAEAMAERCRVAGVEACAEPAAALAGASLVFSLVTADQALAAARRARRISRPERSGSTETPARPGAKRAAAAAVEAAGGRYVDMAIMAPVYPKRHRAPVLLAGPEAEAAAERLSALGMAPAIAGARVGDASTIKMLRSVMMKGLEALTAECVLAARKAGVEGAVLGSLQASDPGFDWESGRPTASSG